MLNKQQDYHWDVIEDKSNDQSFTKALLASSKKSTAVYMMLAALGATIVSALVMSAYIWLEMINWGQ